MCATPHHGTTRHKAVQTLSSNTTSGRSQAGNKRNAVKPVEVIHEAKTCKNLGYERGHFLRTASNKRLKSLHAELAELVVVRPAVPNDQRHDVPQVLPEPMPRLPAATECRYTHTPLQASTDPNMSPNTHTRLIGADWCRKTPIDGKRLCSWWKRTVAQTFIALPSLELCT